MSESRVLFLLTYALKNSMPLFVARALRDRGVKVSISYYVDEPSLFTQDKMEDFRSDDAVIDLSKASPRDYGTIISDVVNRNDVGVIFQIGCEPLYRHLPYIKEQHPRIRIFDVLYNEIGHVISHFMFENMFESVVVESDSMRKYVERSTDKHHPNVTIIENGIKVQDYRWPGVESSSVPRTIGYIGRFSPEKNPLGFVDLANALGTALPSLRFKMFGEGPLESALKNRLFSSHLRDRIEIGGFVERVGDALAQIDILVVPSLFDGRPNVVMEANACGVPVIAAPVGALPELIEEGRNGHICSPLDVGRIADLITAWHRDPASWLVIRENCRRVAEDRFSHRTMTERWIALVS